MLYDEAAVKANIRNRAGKRIFVLGKHDTLTPSARDYLSRERIAIVPPEEMRKDRWQLLGGGYVEEKPEHMTHLNGDILVCKTHPRIAFRGAMDMLEAELLLCQLDVEQVRRELGEILALARSVLRCEVMEEPLPAGKLCGLTEAELRKHSHFPQEYYGQPHFMPEWADGGAILRLNRLRCIARQAELMAVRAFLDGEGRPTRTDILQAMNRISSMIYILMVRMKSGK